MISWDDPFCCTTHNGNTYAIKTIYCAGYSSLASPDIHLFTKGWAVSNLQHICEQLWFSKGGSCCFKYRHSAVTTADSSLENNLQRKIWTKSLDLDLVQLLNDFESDDTKPFHSEKMMAKSHCNNNKNAYQSIVCAHLFSIHRYFIMRKMKERRRGNRFLATLAKKRDTL